MKRFFPVPTALLYFQDVKRYSCLLLFISLSDNFCCRAVRGLGRVRVYTVTNTQQGKAIGSVHRGFSLHHKGESPSCVHMECAWLTLEHRLVDENNSCRSFTGVEKRKWRVAVAQSAEERAGKWRVPRSRPSADKRRKMLSPHHQNTLLATHTL